MNNLFQVLSMEGDLTKNLSLGKRLPVYMIITELAYPMGGGEAYMYDTIRLMKNEFAVVWVAFREEFSGRPQEEEIHYSKENSCLFHTTAKDYNVDSVKYFFTKYQPWIVHCQGDINRFMIEANKTFNIPIVAGFHFWSGLIIPGLTMNINMLENYKKFKIDKTYISMDSPLVKKYVVSEFMNKILSLCNFPTVEKIVHPLTDPEKFLSLKEPNLYTPEKRMFITAINIHKLKGGEILLNLLRNLPVTFPGKFILVCSEGGSRDLDDLLRKEILRREGSSFRSYGDLREVYGETRILLLPTLVDETFGRVAFEAASNGIPIITTGRGYIREMLGDSAIYLDEDPKKWKIAIERLYEDFANLREFSKGVKDRIYELERESTGIKSLLMEHSLLSKHRGIGFFCPWGDQGLGLQCKYYAKILIKNGFRVSIFSYRSYFTDSLKLQNDPVEWNDPTVANGFVYYSFNDRENVGTMELRCFISSSGIGTMIVPEICWKPIFDKTLFMQLQGVRVFAIPNIEITRKSEISNYKIFSKVLFNTKICQKLLEEQGIHGEYIGHGIEGTVYPINKPEITPEKGIVFLHVSGYNAIIRKQTHKVIDAFRRIERMKMKFSCKLIVLMQGKIPESLGDLPGNVLLIQKKLPHDEVMRYYSESHVSIHVSSHEGLALGLYESLSEECPVITVDYPPQNEPITGEGNGWILPITKRKLSDNDDALVEESIFNVEDLGKLLMKIGNDEEHVRGKVFPSEGPYSEKEFSRRFITSIFS